MLREKFAGLEPIDAVYPGKAFDAVDNVKKNFGLTLDEVIDMAVSNTTMTEAKFKSENSKNIGAVGVIVRSTSTSVEDGVAIGKATVNIVMNSGKHHLLPSWLPSGDLVIRFAGEVVPTTEPAQEPAAQEGAQS